ncbi:DUF2971 domain-containing protein [Methylobacterium sp. NMS14P]|uniref:DUF2971 domain-containing protein n=1 Tax=Methylobacterium sp. NMS14P TaxID=2894310 RepID=UPI0023584383|nr:DUF2971 domain-containing protein [Methylobacterium sp. NMS14P]WCS26539.1 DUF2971 domain-containing protein [Methylobacterium sp. NMS14P]
MQISSGGRRSIDETEYEEMIKIVASQVDSFAAECRDQIEDTSIKSILSSRSEKVYHYTNDYGLEGILKKKELWLTDIFSLNDPTELLHGLDMFRVALAEPPNLGITRLNDKIKELNELNPAQVLPSSARFFVLSTSWHRNDLGQWRSYADNGRGFALEFDRLELSKHFDTTFPGGKYYAVIYDDADVMSKMGIIAQRAKNILQNISNGPQRYAIDDAVDMVIEESLRAATEIALYYKHSGYKDEQEFRYVNIPDVKTALIENRRRHYEIVEYQALNLSSHISNIVRGITVGPSGGANSRKFAADVLRIYGGSVSNIPISSSNIPYRG